MILSISLVFNSVGWAIFNPKGATEQTIFGLRLLMFVFPAIALAIGILATIKFPITKERYEEIKQELEKLHAQKREKLQ
jgi:Na+/melibiose symporter-like transporter